LNVKLYDFFIVNNYIDKNIQKGFWPKSDGLSEHTEMLSYLMHDAKRNMRTVVITLLDLKNAFGEAHHNLIRSCLNFHHVPSLFTEIFNSIYCNYRASIAVNYQRSESIAVERGVLQGDPCSPLLFNICFNTLMLTISKPEVKGLGYIWGAKTTTSNCSWLQFADDAVTISNSISDSQALLNIFSAWCHWANMIIRLDKCCCFAMTKCNGVYGQIEPALFINNSKMPCVPISGTFTYLGKLYNSNLKNEQAKLVLTQKLSELLAITSKLKIKVQLKLKILKQYVHSQLRFELKTYNFGSTWIVENLDPVVTKHV